MAITRTPIIDDDGTGTTGTVIDSAWKIELYNQIDAADVAASAAVGGVWASVAFNAANFWTGVTAGMVSVNFYSVVGKTMFWIVRVNNAPAPPSTPYLPMTIPGGYAIYGGTAILCPLASATDNAVVQPGALYLNGVGGPTTLSVAKTSFAPWTGPLTIFGTAIIGLA